MLSKSNNNFKYAVTFFYEEPETSELLMLVFGARRYDHLPN